jgi:hypothetical protein
VRTTAAKKMAGKAVCMTLSVSSSALVEEPETLSKIVESGSTSSGRGEEIEM